MFLTCKATASIFGERVGWREGVGDKFNKRLKGVLLCLVVLSLRLFLFYCVYMVVVCFVISFVRWLVFLVFLVAVLVEIFMCLLVESSQEETA